MTSAMSNGREAGTERRRSRVQEAITTAARHGTPLTASAIARAAQVDRTFLYRHRDLLELLHAAGLRSAGEMPEPGTATGASLQADLANANARAARLSARVQQLETLLSRHLGNQAWHESGLGSPACTEELQQTITKLEQGTADLTTALEEREAELKAAREANRQLTRALNQRE
ncbi:hypothetical protein AB0P17_10000 [Streptomyces sp. NPDC088124]|uniref:hypothetical protein n=1 Tax=Streptomyces TaxID=1883 RepID=UPI00278744E6|nr:hypothetical protein [Streptomyces afghaniensis]MDQ1014842.1 DNA repair exonuclease SbcCD ATPase subunit [Streptomyces afghaniensis]